MNFLLDVYIHLTDKYLYEMANVPTKFTGLKATVYIAWKGNISHGPRIKVSNISGTFSKDNFTMTIDKEPRIIGKCTLSTSELEDISDWVKLNYDYLMNIWHNGNNMDPIELVTGFKKI